MIELSVFDNYPERSWRYGEAAALGFQLVEVSLPYELPAEELLQQAERYHLKHILINAPAGISNFVFPKLSLKFLFSFVTFPPLRLTCIGIQTNYRFKFKSALFQVRFKLALLLSVILLSIFIFNNLIFSHVWHISFIVISSGNWSEGFRGLAALPEQRSKYVESLDIAVQYAKKLNVQKVPYL